MLLLDSLIPPRDLVGNNVIVPKTEKSGINHLDVPLGLLE